MVPSPAFLLERAGLSLPVLGLYDAPDPGAFAPLVRPAPGRHACVFQFWNAWMAGKTLLLTPDRYGCGGAGRAFFGAFTRSRADYVEFLHGEEGLKCSPEAMGAWLDRARPLGTVHGSLLIGPLRDAGWPYLKTATFLANPDQLALLVLGAWYHEPSPEVPMVTAPFNAGCGLLAPSPDEIDEPRAMIGATDIAMRRHLPPDILAFTVTKPMFERLCSLDERSFLGKRFWRDLQAARRGG